MNNIVIRNRIMLIIGIFCVLIVGMGVLGYANLPGIAQKTGQLRAAIASDSGVDRGEAFEIIAEIEKADAAAIRNLIGGVLFMLLLGASCGLFILRNFRSMARLVGHIETAGVQVNSSVTEIAATARQQQATATEIAATTTEIGATSREISATSRELLRTLREVSGVAEQTASMAGSGHASLARMEEKMRNVMEAAGAINSRLIVLNEKAGNINQVITTISKVADQTNLLSLNAAIEAEKAGEFGRGFAVVATEIRRLADQTAVATFDIEKIVKEIQSAVTAGVMGMDKFSEEVRRGMQEVQHAGAQLSQIITHVQELPPRFNAVNEGMEAQSTGAEQISEALRQLSEASQQTVDSLRQSNEAIGGLNAVALDLRGAVTQFSARSHSG